MTNPPAPSSRGASGWLLAAVVLLVVGAALFWSRRSATTTQNEFVSVMSLGKTYLDNSEADKAIETFQKALQLDPVHPDAHLNLANAFLLAANPEAALREATEVLRLDPGSAAAFYVGGCAHLRLGQFEPALQALQQAKEIDRTINAVAFQLGRAHQELGHFEEARELFDEVVQFESDQTVPIYGASLYNLAQVLLRLGRQDEAKQTLDDYQKLAATQGGRPNDPSVFERCVYTAARAPFILEQPDATGLKITFADATATAFAGGAAGYRGPVGVLDVNGRGTNDLFVLDANRGFRLLLYTNNAFTPVGEPLPVTVTNNIFRRCLVGDLDNDRHDDVLLLGDTGAQLFKLSTNGGVRDITRFAGITNLAGVEGVLVDMDFTAKLDLLAITPGTNSIRAMRNYGNLFSDRNVTSAPPASVTGLSQLIVEDWNNDDLPDLIAARPRQAPRLFLKQRGGGLAETNAPADWPAGRLIAVADLNNDLHPDLIVATADALEIVLTAVPTHLKLPLNGNHLTSLKAIDYDNDGWLDLVAAGDRLQIWRNLGKAGFKETTRALGADQAAAKIIESFVAADLDNDGDTDLLLSLTTGGLQLLRNDGGNGNQQFKLRMLGTRSNFSGLGVRIDYTAPGLRGRRFVTSLPVEIGVGRHTQLTSLNIHWSDIYPALFDVPVQSTVKLQLTELQNPVGSCPYLYAWDGRKFRFVTDLLGAAPIGLPVAEGVYIDADPEEYAWIGNEQSFPPRDGNHVLQITEELREVLYLDQAALVVVDHPAGTEVHPTDKLLPRKPFPTGTLMTLHRRQPLLHATRLDGVEVTAALAENDRQMVSPLKLRGPHLRGQAEPHGVTLDFGPLETNRPLVLALTGWLRFGGGMANIAASHDPNIPFPFPRLEAEVAAGQWQPVEVTVGAPAGKTKTILVELAGKLPPGSRRLRLTTGFEIHWDRAALFERHENAASRITKLAPDQSHLHWRGFSEFEDRPWSEPLTPDYERVSPNPMWRRTLTGWCTRYGEVTELVTERDEAQVLVNGGDELTLKFAANRLPPKPAGFTRDFFIYTDGWDKDADPHVKLGWQVGPLPWHGMDDQKYGDQPRPAFPSDALMKRHTTRWAGPLALNRKSNDTRTAQGRTAR